MLSFTGGIALWKVFPSPVSSWASLALLPASPPSFSALLALPNAKISSSNHIKKPSSPHEEGFVFRMAAVKHSLRNFYGFTPNSGSNFVSRQQAFSLKTVSVSCIIDSWVLNLQYHQSTVFWKWGVEVCKKSDLTMTNIFTHSRSTYASAFPSLAGNFIWSLAESFMMITTLPVFFQAFSRTASFACCFN